MNNLSFINEIASTHNGRKKELNKLIKNIKIQPKDYIKFQIFNNKDLCHKSSKLYNGLKKIELPFNFWASVIKKFKPKNKVILEPFDEKSYAFAKRFKKKVLLKISSSEHDNLSMIRDAVENFHKVFINISGYELKEIINILKNIKNSKKKVILMYGFQSFPSEPENLRLSVIKKIVKAGYTAGYADHSDTFDPIGTYLSTARAIDYGASYIEKHVTLDRSKKKPDYITSFNPNDLDKYISFFKKEYLKKFKTNLQKISKKEHDYCKLMGKHAVALKDFKKGEQVDSKFVKFLRTGTKGISRQELQALVRNKKKFKKNIFKNSIIKKKYI